MAIPHKDPRTLGNRRQSSSTRRHKATPSRPSRVIAKITDFPKANGAALHAAIQRAKQEWEGTADALATLVCLLDFKGRVLRTNRVVEDWLLGTVTGVLGKQAHGVLHPGCR